MSACCGDDHTTNSEDDAAPESLLQVSEIRWAAAAGVILLASFIVGWNDLHRSADVLAVAAAGVGGRTFVPGTLRSLRRAKIGVGTLMTLAGGGALALGEFQEAARLAFLFSISEGLEEFSVGRAQRGLRALLTLVPETAVVRRAGVEQEIPSATIRIGETLIVRPGGRIATDGTIRAGHSTMDMAAITGDGDHGRQLTRPGRPSRHRGPRQQGSATAHPYPAANDPRKQQESQKSSSGGRTKSGRSQPALETQANFSLTSSKRLLRMVVVSRSCTNVIVHPPSSTTYSIVSASFDTPNCFRLMIRSNCQHTSRIGNHTSSDTSRVASCEIRLSCASR